MLLEIKVHHKLGIDSNTLDRLDKIVSQLSDAVKSLQDDVTGLEAVEAKVLTYLQGVPALISAAITSAEGDGAQAAANLLALTKQIETDTASMQQGLDVAPVAPETGQVPA